MARHPRTGTEHATEEERKPLVDTVTIHRDANGAVTIEQHPARIVITDPTELQRVAHTILDYALDDETTSDLLGAVRQAMTDRWST